jgi:hypothetical protein
MKYLTTIFIILILSLPIFSDSKIAKKGKILLSQIFSTTTPEQKRYDLPESYKDYKFKSSGVMEEDFDEQEGNEEEQENEEIEEAL